MSRYAQLRWAEVKVGLLVLIALTMLVVMIMSLEEGVGLPGSQYKFRAVVPHTQSLKVGAPVRMNGVEDRKSTRLNSSHLVISYAVFCLKKKTKNIQAISRIKTRNAID